MKRKAEPDAEAWMAQCLAYAADVETGSSNPKVKKDKRAKKEDGTSNKSEGKLSRAQKAKMKLEKVEKSQLAPRSPKSSKAPKGQKPAKKKKKAARAASEAAAAAEEAPSGPPPSWMGSTMDDATCHTHRHTDRVSGKGTAATTLIFFDVMDLR